MHADLEDEIALRTVAVEFIDRFPHSNAACTASAAVENAAITASPIVLVTAPLCRTVTSRRCWKCRCTWMGVEVADPLVERGRALEIGEHQRHVENRDAFGRADHLRAEEIAEGLGHQQPLAGQICRETKLWALRGLRRKLQDAEHHRQLAGVVNLEHDLPGAMLAAVAATTVVERNRHAGRRVPIPSVTGKRNWASLSKSWPNSAFGGVDLEACGRTWFDAGEHPHQPFGGLVPTAPRPA